MNSVDQFLYDTLIFLGNLHDCHKCNAVLNQVNGRGKRRTFCDKYKLPISRVCNNCIDRFSGFNSAEINNIEKQHNAGVAVLCLETKQKTPPYGGEH